MALRELHTEDGLSLLTEDDVVLLADGHEAPSGGGGTPGEGGGSTTTRPRVRGLVYHRTTGLLEWLPVEGATSYSVEEGDGAGSLRAAAFTSSTNSIQVGALQEGQHRSFRVTATLSDGSLSLPSNPIHAAGPKRKL